MPVHAPPPHCLNVPPKLPSERELGHLFQISELCEQVLETNQFIRQSKRHCAAANTPVEPPGACFAHLPSNNSLPRCDVRVGTRIVTFEACSGFTHVTARRIAQ